MTAPDPFDTPLDYKDRRASLIISGIILGLIGCMIGLMSAAYITIFGFADDFLGATAPPSGGPPGTEVFSESMRHWMVIGGCIYGAVALAFLAVAGGNVFLKRWSRPLALILSGCWAYIGLVTIAWMVIMWPKTQQVMTEQAIAQGGSTPPGAAPDMDAVMGIIMVIYVAIFFIFGVMLPGLIFWLNWSRDARITLEVCDRKSRWTDRCPVPVLAIALVLGASGVMMLGSAFWMPFMPVFGEILTGQSARLVMIGIGAVLLVTAWFACQRQIIAWGLSLVMVVAGSISSVISFADFDWRQMYEIMGMPEVAEEMGDMMETIYSGNTMPIAMAVSALPAIAYLAWSLRYFRNESGEDESAGVASAGG